MPKFIYDLAREERGAFVPTGDVFKVTAPDADEAGQRAQAEVEKRQAAEGVCWGATLRI